MKKLLNHNEIDELYNNNEISLSDASKLRDAWEKSTEDEKKENAIYTKSLENKARKEDAKTYNIISDLSEKKLLTEILKVNRKTSGWIIFIGVVTLVNVIGAIITAVNLYI